LAAQRNADKYGYFLVGVVVLAALWFFAGRAISTDAAAAVVTQGGMESEPRT